MSKVVHLPPDAGLAALLRGPAPEGSSWHLTCRHFGAMANAADPRDRQQAVDLPATLVPVVADDLARLLARAREQADPAADALAAFLARAFGRTETTEVSSG